MGDAAQIHNLMNALMLMGLLHEDIVPKPPQEQAKGSAAPAKQATSLFARLQKKFGF